MRITKNQTLKKHKIFQRKMKTITLVFSRMKTVIFFKTKQSSQIKIYLLFMKLKAKIFKMLVNV